MGDRWALPCWYSLEDLVHTASQPGATLQWPVLPPRSQSHTAPPAPDYTDLLTGTCAPAAGEAGGATAPGR